MEAYGLDSKATFYPRNVGVRSEQNVDHGCLAFATSLSSVRIDANFSQHGLYYRMGEAKSPEIDGPCIWLKGVAKAATYISGDARGGIRPARKGVW